MPCTPSEDLPNPGIEPRSPTLQADSLRSESPGKPKNTGRGSLSLLQGKLSRPRNEPGSPASQADSLPAALPGKPEHSTYIVSAVYMCQSQALNSSHHHPFPLGIQTLVLYVSLFNLCTQGHLYHCCRFHIYMLINNIWFSF